MSILIKSMEMPKSCMNCMFCGFAGANCELDTCLITGSAQKHIPHSKMPDCPLIEVPPHGRLIDADALTYVMGMDEHFSPLEALMHLMGLVDAPTIIPADKKE